MAVGAVDLVRTLGTARAAAGIAGRKAVVDDLLLDARRDLLERQAQADAHVASLAARRRASSRSASEKGREDIAHAEAAEHVVEIDRAVTARARSARNGAEAVVLGALLRVG